MTNLERAPNETVLRTGDPCATVEVLEPREVPLGGPRALTVYRALPHKTRSLVGAWCFLDHYGPNDVAKTGGMVVPRHPHTGLATVSWLFSGEIDHVDSGGNTARVRPGELNLMIAGSGITHQEISTHGSGELHGVQLWYALPERSRHSPNGFVNYVPEPVSFGPLTARVFIGELFGSVSPVVTRTGDLLGAELRMSGGSSVSFSLRDDFEYAPLAEDGPIMVGGVEVPQRAVAVIPTGSTTLEFEAGSQTTRVLLLGGVPLGESIVMWWNFVGRSHEEIVEYRARYQEEMGFEPVAPGHASLPRLFGQFPSGQPAALPAPVLPNTRLKPRASSRPANNSRPLA